MTIKKITMFAAIMATIVLFLGCKKENEPSNDANFSCADPSLTIMSEIARYSHQTDFKDVVYKMVISRFDGDDDVLCKDVLSKTKEISNDTLSKVLQYYQQQGLYPQIYIPYFEELKKRKTKENVIFINGIGADESQLAFQGYYFENDVIVPTPFLIDEEYAMNHEVWVISLNERVDENGNPLTMTGKLKEADGASEPKTSRSGKKHERVEKIKCPNLSEIESWIYGAPELQCVCHSHLIGNLTTQYFYPNSRSDINNVFWTVDNGTSRKMYYWNTGIVSSYVNFLWVELDNSGSTVNLTNTYSIPLDNGTTNTITFTTQIKEEDDNCGSYTPYYNDGRVGHSYETGLICWIDEYR